MEQYKSKFKSSKDANRYLNQIGTRTPNGEDIILPEGVTFLIKNNVEEELKKTIKCSDLENQKIKDVDFYVNKKSPRFSILEYNDVNTDYIIKTTSNKKFKP